MARLTRAQGRARRRARYEKGARREREDEEREEQRKKNVLRRKNGRGKQESNVMQTRMCRTDTRHGGKAVALQKRLGPVWDRRGPPRCFLLHALRKLLHTAFGNVLFAQKCRCESVSGSRPAWSFQAVCTGVQHSCLHSSTVHCRLQERATQFLPTTACSLRASFVERAGVQLDASHYATQFVFFLVFLTCDVCTDSFHFKVFAGKKQDMVEKSMVDLD